MPKLRHLSGDEIGVILRRYGFTFHSQTGSHMKFRRVTAGGQEQMLIVPRYAEIGTGLMHTIFRQASRFIPDSELRKDFYSD